MSAAPKILVLSADPKRREELSAAINAKGLRLRAYSCASMEECHCHIGESGKMHGAILDLPSIAPENKAEVINKFGHLEHLGIDTLAITDTLPDAALCRHRIDYVVEINSETDFAVEAKAVAEMVKKRVQARSRG